MAIAPGSRRRLSVAMCLWLAACQAEPPTATPLPPVPPTPTAGPPAVLALAGGAIQWTREFQPMGRAITLRLLDAQQRALNNAIVRFEVVRGGGWLADTVARSAVDGIVTAPRWTMGAADSIQRLRAHIGTLSIEIDAYAFRMPVAATGERVLFARGDTILQSSRSGTDARPLRVLPSSLQVGALSGGDSLIALWDTRGDSVCVSALLSDHRHCVSVRGFGEPTAFAWRFGGQWVQFHARRATACPSGTGVCYLPGYATVSLDLELGQWWSSSDLLATPAARDYSPDGRFEAVGLEGSMQISDLELWEAEFLTLPKDVRVSSVRWAPDGRRLAMGVTFTTPCAPTCSTAIATINADGTDFRILVTANAAAGERVREPVWSPDGGRIAFARDRPDGATGAGSDVYWIGAGGGTESRWIANARLLSWR